MQCESSFCQAAKATSDWFYSGAKIGHQPAKAMMHILHSLLTLLAFLKLLLRVTVSPNTVVLVL